MLRTNRVETKAEAPGLRGVSFLAADAEPEQPVEVLVLENGVVVAEQRRPLQRSEFWAEPSEPFSPVVPLVEHEGHASGARIVRVLKELPQNKTKQKIGKRLRGLGVK